MDKHLVEQVNDHRDELGVDDSLHLLLVACCDVGQEPHCLLQDKKSNFLLWTLEVETEVLSVCKSNPPKK